LEEEKVNNRRIIFVENEELMRRNRIDQKIRIKNRSFDNLKEVEQKQQESAQEKINKLDGQIQELNKIKKALVTSTIEYDMKRQIAKDNLKQHQRNHDNNINDLERTVAQQEELKITLENMQNRNIKTCSEMADAGFSSLNYIAELQKKLSDYGINAIKLPIFVKKAETMFNIILKPF